MSLLGDPDLALLEHWRAGDIGAGEELYRRHASAVIRFFRNKVRREVQDLTQETFVRIVAARDRILDGEAFRAFVIGVARRVLLEHLRGLERDRAFDPAVDSIADLLPGPSSIAARKLEHRLLVEGLRRLALEHQILLELYYWEGMRATQLAAVLGISSSTMRSRLARARELLREQIAELAPAQELIVSTMDDLEGWAEQVRAAHLCADNPEVEVEG